MKRSDIGELVRQGKIGWASRVPGTHKCRMIVIRSSTATSSCANSAMWAFTAGTGSTVGSGVYCWSHLLKIMTRGEELVRLEDLLKAGIGV